MSAEVSEAEARAALAAVLAGGAIGVRSRQRALLAYLVEEWAAGRADRLKAYALGVDVFGRSQDFDPAADSIVRVEVARLRQSLAHHYRTVGAADPVEIAVPAGGYAPRFTRRAAAAARPRRLDPARAGVAAAGVAALAAALWAVAVSGPAPQTDRPDVLRVHLDVDGREAETLAAEARARAVSFTDVTLVEAAPARLWPEDYVLRVEIGAAGPTIDARHALSGATVAAAVGREDATTALSRLFQSRGPLYRHYIRAGDYGPVMACVLRARRYFEDQTDETHAAARGCAEALIADGVAAPALHLRLAQMHREEFTDGRNPRPGDPLARALDAASTAALRAPGDPEVLETQLSVHQLMGQRAEVARLAGEIEALAPYDAQRLTGVAGRLAAVGAFAEAAALIERSQDLNPPYSEVRAYMRFLALTGLGRRAEAAEIALGFQITENALHLTAVAAAAGWRGDAALAAPAVAALRAAEPGFDADPAAMHRRRRYDPALIAAFEAGLTAAIALADG